MKLPTEDEAPPWWLALLFMMIILSLFLCAVIR
jgi:hypothetical protein